ncbi:efflux transporter outer membrane subunit [Cupriavidus necator]|uniref:efflux transporter outer membrane subunit n=1 Tax=Cupriavidus necator TaxID=106590 RepID=UPI0039C4E48F
MIALRRLWVASISPFLFACTTVGPDYKIPDNAAVRSQQSQGRFTASEHASVSGDLAPDAWWRLYEDERLDGIVLQALKANADIRVAMANLRRAVAAYHEVEAESLPQGEFRGKAERAQLSGQSFLQTTQPPVFNLGDFGLGVSYLIDLFGKLARADEAALAAAQASEAALDSVRIAVVAHTVRAYVMGCAANHELEVAQHQLEIQERAVSTTRRLADHGRTDPTAPIRAQVQADLLRGTLPTLRAMRDEAHFQLAYLLGKSPAALPREETECHAEPSISRPLPVGDGAALLKRRPDIRQAERELAAATARIGVATADLYPSISIGASAGLTGIMRDLGSGPTARWGVGPLLTWNFPTNGVRPRIHGREAEADAALARFDRAVLKALQETETALSAYTNAQQQVDALRSATKQAEEAARHERARYRAGRSPYLAQLDAERTMADTSLALAQAESKVALKQVDLFLALGGGWQSSQSATSSSHD